jgi:hypothetical protein
MSNLDEPNGATNDPSQHPTPASDGRDGLERRVQELERENTRLKAALSEAQTARERDREILNAVILADLPQNEEEFKAWTANSTSFSELLREMEREFGLESPK